MGNQTFGDSILRTGPMEIDDLWFYLLWQWQWKIPSGNQTWHAGKRATRDPMILRGKSSINGRCSILRRVGFMGIQLNLWDIDANLVLKKTRWLWVWGHPLVIPKLGHSGNIMFWGFGWTTYGLRHWWLDTSLLVLIPWGCLFVQAAIARSILFFLVLLPLVVPMYHSLPMLDLAPDV